MAKVNIADEEELKKIFRSVKPARKKYDFVSRRNRDNRHLNNLHNVQMKKILCKNPPPDGTPVMERFTDSRGHVFLHLPSVNQTAKPRVDDNGRVWHGGLTEKIIREKTWRSADQYPPIDTPSRLYIIESLSDDLFHDAVDTLDHSSIVGFSSEGKMVGREGTLSWLVFSTERDVFMFDIIKLGKDAFKYGLKAILQSTQVLKIVHNGQHISDCLYHQMGIEMENVIDTMASDLVFCSQHVFGGHIPKYYRSLPRLLMDYLGISHSHIFFPRYRRTHLAEDSHTWIIRPALDHLVLGAARNCLYLIPLHHQLRVGNMLSLNLATNILLASIRDKNDPEADRVNLADLPEEFSQLLRNDTPRRKLKIQDNIFVHQSIHNSDPLCVFSKDCMHQTQVIYS